jgi:energy-coupling factor transporter ATP-binding protein EcfA2
VLTDIKMPPGHSDEGLVAAQEIRRKHPEIGVLVLSHYLESRYAMRLLEDFPERTGYLLKDRVSDVAVLADALRRIAEGECVLDPTIVARLVARRENAGPLAELTEREREVLALVGLAGAADARLRTYSKGMLQRIGIAQAIVHDPSVVFLDEPMSGLDPVGRKEIRDLVVRLNADGKTIFMNTHILSDVETICDRVAIIVQGRIAYQGVLDNALAAGERKFDVTLSSLSPEFAEEAEARFEAELSGRADRITLRVADKHMSELVQGALAHGASIEEVAPVRLGLEALFLEAVAGTIPGDAR